MSYKTGKARNLHAQAQKRYADKQPPEWLVWKAMKARCYNRSHITYEYYGGRGIKVCARWLEYRIGFRNFLADMGPRPSDTFSLDRKDPDKDYSKENCRWLERSKNSAASRGCFGYNSDENGEHDVVEDAAENAGIADAEVVPF